MSQNSDPTTMNDTRPPARMAPVDAVEDLVRQLERLREQLLERERVCRADLLRLPPERYASGQNLLHYLALRSQDLRPLQRELYHRGLSSLGRAESCVQANLEVVLGHLREDPPEGRSPVDAPPAAFAAGEQRLERNTVQLFGAAPAERKVYIMVTLPAQAADDYLLVERLLENGMDCARINCSHDGRDAWRRMVENVRNASRATGRRCRVLMDLGGPKLRTGRMAERAGVLKIRPRRSDYGKVVRPARIWLHAPDYPPVGDPGGPDGGLEAALAVDASWLATLRAGDRISFEDARGSRRRWRVTEVTGEGCLVQARKTAYLVNDLELCRNGDPDRQPQLCRLQSIPPGHERITVRAGDTLRVCGDGRPGRAELRDPEGELLQPGCVSLPIDAVYRDTRTGESIWFDDGRIGGVIQAVEEDCLTVLVQRTRRREERLEADRGINLPDTDLKLPALGEKDLEDLPFVAGHADLIGLSFVNHADDVVDLRRRLLDLGAEQRALVVKIETRRGFVQLPGILLAALQFPACGVMIARGDLAVECGFERLAEIQEQILWVCEAAHVPVIWATQVLENLTKRGLASRAEITDAAASQSAECVMLNKGPHIDKAVSMLDDILQRMQRHRSKKRSMLHRLRLADWAPDRGGDGDGDGNQT